MTNRTRLTSVEAVREAGSWLFTVRDAHGGTEEAILVPCSDQDGKPVRAWLNRCTHEHQRLDVGRGVARRNGQVVCPRHGSMFDACEGTCDNGPAADTRLLEVDVTVEDGTVYLVDHVYAFAHEGGMDDPDGSEWADEGDDDMPSSTSHIGF